MLAEHVTHEETSYRMGWVIGNIAIKKSQEDEDLSFRDAVILETRNHYDFAPLSMGSVDMAPEQFQLGKDAAIAGTLREFEERYV